MTNDAGQSALIITVSGAVGIFAAAGPWDNATDGLHSRHGYSMRIDYNRMQIMIFYTLIDSLMCCRLESLE